MQILIEIILPVFGLILLGYVAARFGWFEEAGIKGLSSFVFNFAIPVMLFRSIAIAELPAHIPWDFLATFYLSAFVLFAVAMLIGGQFFRIEPSHLGIYGMGASYSNVILIGIPLILMTYGEDATIPLFLIVSTHAAIMFFVTTAVLEASSGDLKEIRQLPLLTAKTMAKNVIFLGICLGLLFNLLKIPIPSVIDNIALSLSGAALPCAVFSMGASLSQYRVKGEISRSLMLVLFKNLLHPLLIWFLITQVFTIEPLWAAVALILSACPIGVNTYLFAQRYQILIPTSATAIVVSTLVSFFSLSVLLWLLEVR